jgi:hypothetical protein
MFIRLLCVSAVVSALPGRKHAGVATTLAVAHEELADIDAELDAEIDAERTQVIKGFTKAIFSGKTLDGQTLDPGKMRCPKGWNTDDTEVTMQMGTKGGRFDHQSLVFKLKEAEESPQCWLGELEGDAEGSSRSSSGASTGGDVHGIWTSIKRTNGKIVVGLPIPFTLDRNDPDVQDSIAHWRLVATRNPNRLSQADAVAMALRPAGIQQCNSACSAYYDDENTAPPTTFVKRGKGGIATYNQDDQSCTCEHIKLFDCKDSLFDPTTNEERFQTTKQNICAAFEAANNEWAKKAYKFLPPGGHNCQTWRTYFEGKIKAWAKKEAKVTFGAAKSLLDQPK